jgi:hypothetical protein
MNEKNSILSRMGHHSSRYTAQEADVIGGLSEAFEASVLPVALRLQNFPRYVRRQDIARFLAKYRIFEQSMAAAGSIVECGVFAGGGAMGWAHFSAILEPYNHTRRVIGFDTFSGFPELSEKDTRHGLSEHLHQGAFRTDNSIISEIQHLIALHDRNRPLGHIPKTELVAGDACETIPRYVEENPHLLVSLLYLDFDLYEPTKAALQHLYPRVVKGGVVAFDELNCPEFPGETLALIECLELAGTKLRRFPFDPYISYFIKE